MNPSLAKELIAAAEVGHIHLIEWFLVARLLDADLCGEILSAASHKGNIQIVRLLLKHGCEVQFDDNRPLFLAQTGGSLAIIRLLLSNGARSNFSHTSTAAQDGNHLFLGLLMPTTTWSYDELDQLLGIAGATADATGCIRCIQTVIRHCSTDHLLELLTKKDVLEYEENPGLEIVQVLAHEKLRFRRYTPDPF